MANNREEDILRINALVDGELAPSERAAIAGRIAADRDLARAHATLARLKAAVIETADDTPAIAVQTRPRKSWRLASGLGSAAAALAVAAFVMFSSESPGPGADSMDTDRLVRLAAFPRVPVLPELEPAGLRLANVEIRTPRDRRVLVATYSGSRGCRLELHIQPKDAAPPAADGTSRHAWVTGDLAYELLAFGMPEWRFALVAASAERQTRQGSDPDNLEGRLRQAQATAPPCLG